MPPKLLAQITEPVLSICGFRYRDEGNQDWDDINARILRRFARETQTVVSSTVVDGTFVLRPCFINARTNAAHVEEFVRTVVRMGDELTGADVSA